MSPPLFPRTLVVGWDGAEPGLLGELIAERRLPVLAALRQEARWGELRSTVPPMTLPAWASFLTGVPPGEHGIFDFFTREGDRLRPLDARDRLRPTLFARLQATGLRVASLFFPTTWPPEALTACVSGFDSPLATTIPASACHPRGLWAWLQAAPGGPIRYAEVDELRRRPGWEARARQGLLQGIRKKEVLARTILARAGPLDVLAVLFGESDTAAHHFWDLHDRASPRHDPVRVGRWGETVREVYVALDAALGRLLRDGQWGAVVLASDHGSGAASSRVLHLQAALAQSGLLRWGGAPPVPADLRRHALARIPDGPRDRLLRLLPARWTAELEGRARWAGVDLKQSAAISDELNYAPSVWVRRPPEGPWAGRSEGELRGLLERALLDLRDPADGARVVARVLAREDVAAGPGVERSPHLWLDLATVDGGTWVLLPSRPGGPVTSRVPKGSVATKGAGMPGSHRPFGHFLVRAPGLRPGSERWCIEDVLPRFLEAVGTPVEKLPTPPLQVGVRTAEREAGGAEGVRALRDRLRALGYLP